MYRLCRPTVAPSVGRLLEARVSAAAARLPRVGAAPRRALSLPESERPLPRYVPRLRGRVRGDISNPNYEPATLRTYLFWGFSAVGVFVCLSAGVWQMRRHDWKAELIERRGKQLEADPQDLTAALATTGGKMTKELDFRRVVFSGEFDYAKQLLVGPRPPPPGSAPALAPSGHGYYLVTPCRLADGSSIFVNRGWVPVNVVQQSYFAELAPTLTGVLRLGEHRPVYESAARKEASDALQAGAVAQERYFFSDINATLVNLGQRSGPPVLVDVLEPAVAHGFPVRKEAKGFLTFNIMPTMHYVYAGTWFTLGTFIAILMRRRFRPHLFRALGNYYYPRPPRAQPPSPGPP